ncbi:hypothetical protein [Brumicola pallidula]|uniref:Glycosyl hydrolase 36 catalytic domain-containing protein n=1 Tax=Brumicola pallidula DSM 14239 = ACAM 615 TaxID=1121922 RepID=K7A5M4_9ALTE|nr:hypothetical protein [Glaciecola pallidula]GAC30770.1 hypothetical protein GPAL_3930 [Glaciecola pallidula DSM 14239 = ACAM 615]
MDNKSLNADAKPNDTVSGAYIQMDGDTYYKISHVDQMAPFFISVVSDQDHWLFAGSTGGLTMGRVSPDKAVFPYVTVDKLYESTPHTGPKTIIKVIQSEHKSVYWEPYNREHDDRYHVTRNLYKNLLGNVLCFEEINHDLQLAFRYSWQFSSEFGISRQCKLENLAAQPCSLELIDGLQNILPAGTPSFTQSQSSNLVDAYKWTEVDQETGLALYTLYSAITDRAEPVEALRANTVFRLGLPGSTVHLTSSSLDLFKAGQVLHSSDYSRGVRSCYLVHSHITLGAHSDQKWSINVDVEKDQTDVVALKHALLNKSDVNEKMQQSFLSGSDKLARIMASSDGFQVTAEEDVSLHHYANTLFNVLRGGIFANQYLVSRADLLKTLQHFNHDIYARQKAALSNLPENVSLDELMSSVEALQDVQLSRLVYEYLPITFGRRHGDPSRPWNQFAIELKDDRGQPLLSYQGNWRDIFQNWEALTLSYPSFIESVIAKFVNASTLDGYNPYRITKQGIDWEIEEPDDPWSYIGYWGDHQIIYLLKLLESSNNFHPGKLASLLEQSVYSYANVPYRIKPLHNIIDSPKDTVLFDNELAEDIERNIERLGSDGKLVLDAQGQVYQVSLVEKLFIPLLSKLSNLVIDGGIWLNTQRPEWNDANNALVGQGLSMVTLCYLNRYLTFVTQLLVSIEDTNKQFAMTTEVAEWLTGTTHILQSVSEQINQGPVSSSLQFSTLQKLGTLASEYRAKMYRHSGNYTQEVVSINQLKALLSSAKPLITRSIEANYSESGLYHAYNVLSINQKSLNVSHLYDMLEGQVAALSSGALSSHRAVDVMDTLYASDMYRADQKTFMLYPDRKQQGFISKNCVPKHAVMNHPLLAKMLAQDDNRLIKLDILDNYRFNSELTNANAIKHIWPLIAQEYPDLASDNALDSMLDIYESVFNHSAFTGRSGGMFGFEGLGCIYWHMVSKLLLAVQEVAIRSVHEEGKSATSQALIAHYYNVRLGIGFNKTPQEYGAFPADPYSHTPKHAGAQQPGMTGQVKEELLTRMGELGCFVTKGRVSFDPFLLRAQEFTTQATTFRYLDINEAWKTINLDSNSLAFTWCQVPVIYSVSNNDDAQMTIYSEHGKKHIVMANELDQQFSQMLFARSGGIVRIDVSIGRNRLYSAS